MVSRRGFVFLLGAGATGLWLAGTGLVTLARRFVLELAGRCSFCRKDKTEVRALVGVAGRPTRICDECVALCFDIIAMEEGRMPEPPPVEEAVLPSEPMELRRYLEELGAAPQDIEGLLASAKEHLDGPPWQEVAKTATCSFCDAPRGDVRKLISGGLHAFICDVCVGGAAAIMNGVRPLLG